MDSSHIWKIFDDSILEGYTLLVPSVAVGNVGQLACDLLISTFSMKKVASIYTPAQIPVMGYDPYDLKSNSLSSSCELYKSVSKKILVLQLRSPLVYKYAANFLEDVVSKLMNKKIRDVIILTSSFAHEKKHILSSPFRFVTGVENPHIKKLKEASFVQHEVNNGVLKIYGGGFASLLLQICVQKSLPSLILYKYCSEGDNIPDAYDMVDYLSKVVPLFSKEKDLFEQLKQPVSWTLLFGRPPPADIY